MKNLENKKIKTGDSKTDIAHEVAETMGYENAKDLMERTITDINSKNPAKAQAGRAIAAEFTKQLALLILYQEIESPKIPNKYGWAKHFNDGVISQGNSKEFIMTIPTGNDEYNPDNFVPTKHTSPLIETKIISMYIEKQDGTREKAPNTYQYLKPLTILESQWYPYFMTGKLGEFIARITELMRKSYDLFIISKMENFIKTMTFKKTITGDGNGIQAGTAQANGKNMDMFACLSNEVIPHIEKMSYLNTEYNLSATSKNIGAPSPSDILVFMNNTIKSKLRTGVMTRLFNANLISLDQVVPAENWIGTAGSITVSNSDTAITIGNDWIDNNTIYVFTKDAIKHCLQINRTESQAWATNMTIQIVLHIWGTVDSLPWEKGFKYTSDKLSVLPN